MEKELKYKENLIDDVIENTIIIKGPDGSEKHYNEAEMRKQFAPLKATDAQWNYFKTVAESQGLDPYNKEIYMSVMDEYEGYGENRKKVGEKVVPLTGYLVYVKRMLASGKVKIAPKVTITTPNEKDPDTWYADYTVQRVDMEGALEWRVWMKEVNKKRSLWNIQPKFQLVKTTLSQGTRVWFSDVVGGFPYTPEEITQDESSVEVDVTEGRMEIQGIEPSEEERLAKEKAKAEYIDKIAGGLQEVLTVKDLDTRLTKNLSKINKSELKDDILSIYKNRRESLLVQELSEKTGFTIFEVELALAKGFLPESLLEEILADNMDAKAEFATQMANFLNELKKKENGELNV